MRTVSDGDIYRVPVTDDQFQAIMEAMVDAIDHSSFVARELAQLALSVKHSVDNDWKWRTKDEA